MGYVGVVWVLIFGVWREGGCVRACACVRMGGRVDVGGCGC